MARISILLNIHNYAAAQFLSHGCESAAIYGKELLLAKEDGLYISSGDSDGTTAVEDTEVPVPITSYILLPLYDAGYKGQKSPRSIVLGGVFTGAMKVSITDEKGITVDYVTSNLTTRDGIKIALRSSQRSRYFYIKISNVNGSDFSLDSADFVFIPGPERRT